jgi:hypothetical protein
MTLLRFSWLTLNGRPFDRNWITQAEIMAGSTLLIEASTLPNPQFGIKDPWISDLESQTPI